jgi:hypothetical protein
MGGQMGGQIIFTVPLRFNSLNRAFFYTFVRSFSLFQTKFLLQIKLFTQQFAYEKL